LLGIAPHRLMTARRDRSQGRFAERRNGQRRTMEEIEDFLVALRKAGRRAILIVDADCGDGRRLIKVACRAREFGFRVIDARGYDASSRRIAAAVSAVTHVDRAIDFRFAMLDRNAPLLLDEGGEGQADLLLAAASRSAANLADAIDRDGILIRHR
jgi:hypothetical protein